MAQIQRSSVFFNLKSILSFSSKHELLSSAWTRPQAETTSFFVHEVTPAEASKIFSAQFHEEGATERTIGKR